MLSASGAPELQLLPKDPCKFLFIVAFKTLETVSKFQGRAEHVAFESKALVWKGGPTNKIPRDNEIRAFRVKRCSSCLFHCFDQSTGYLPAEGEKYECTFTRHVSKVGSPDIEVILPKKLPSTVFRPVTTE